MIRIRLNGEDRSIATASTVRVLVAEVAGDSTVRGIAVARNGEVVPRGSWDQVILAGDEIEIVKAVQGG